MATSPTSGPGGGGIPQGGPLTAELDAAGYVINDALIRNSALDDDLDADGNSVVNVSTVAAESGGSLQLFGGSGQDGIEIGGFGIQYYEPVFPNGTDPIYFGANAAPADGNLSASQFVLWLDATPGVGNTKLMVKAKDSGGTVRAAAIVLA